jgi:hypothetical protein
VFFTQGLINEVLSLTKLLRKLGYKHPINIYYKANLCWDSVTAIAACPSGSKTRFIQPTTLLPRPSQLAHSSSHLNIDTIIFVGTMPSRSASASTSRAGSVALKREHSDVVMTDAAVNMNVDEGVKMDEDTGSSSRKEHGDGVTNGDGLERREEHSRNGVSSRTSQSGAGTPVKPESQSSPYSTSAPPPVSNELVRPITADSSSTFLANYDSPTPSKPPSPPSNSHPSTSTSTSTRTSKPRGAKEPKEREHRDVKPPKDSKNSKDSSKPGPQLIGDLPLATDDALATFERLRDNHYQYATLGRSREAMEGMTCECQYRHGE